MQIARGLITETDPKEVKAKAKLPDMEDLETDWLPVLQTLTHQAVTYAMPRVGQQVYIIFVDDHAVEGLILGSRYSQKRKPSETLTEESIYWQLEDGTLIHLKQGEIELETPGKVSIKAKGDINAETAANATIKASGNLNAEIGGNATIKASGSLNAEAGNAVIKASLIKLDASEVQITGQLTVAQEAIIGGKAFLPHTHTSGSPGNPTGPPL